MKKNKYLIDASWDLELSPALQMLEVLEPKVFRIFTVEATEQPSLVVLQKIARILFKEDYRSEGFAIRSITLLEPKQSLKETDKYFKLDENPTDES